MITIDCKDRTINNKHTIFIANLIASTSIDAQDTIQEYVKDITPTTTKWLRVYCCYWY